METSEGGVNVAQLNHGLDAGDFGLSHAMQVDRVLNWPSQVGIFDLWPRVTWFSLLASWPLESRVSTASQEVLSASLSASNCFESHALHVLQFEWIHFRRTVWLMTTTTKRRKGWKWNRANHQRSSPAKLYTSGEETGETKFWARFKLRRNLPI